MLGALKIMAQLWTQHSILDLISNQARSRRQTCPAGLPLPLHQTECLTLGDSEVLEGMAVVESNHLRLEETYLADLMAMSLAPMEIDLVALEMISLEGKV